MNFNLPSATEQTGESDVTQRGTHAVAGWLLKSIHINIKSLGLRRNAAYPFRWAEKGIW